MKPSPPSKRSPTFWLFLITATLFGIYLWCNRTPPPATPCAQWAAMNEKERAALLVGYASGLTCPTASTPPPALAAASTPPPALAAASTPPPASATTSTQGSGTNNRTNATSPTLNLAQAAAHIEGKDTDAWPKRLAVGIARVTETCSAIENNGKRNQAYNFNQLLDTATRLSRGEITLDAIKACVGMPPGPCSGCPTPPHPCAQ